MKHISIVLFILVSFALGAQTAENSERYVKWKREYAKQCIVDLKDGALVVRLKTRKKAIDLYRQSEQNWVADRMEQEQFEENQDIVKAFVANYNFCKVYFIYVDDTERLANGERQGFFLNDKLRLDTTITLTEDFYMFAEFGSVRGEEYVIPTDTTADRSYVSASVIDRAVVIKDANLWQMQDPFPFYINAIFEGKTMNQVRRFSESLARYYEAVIAK